MHSYYVFIFCHLVLYVEQKSEQPTVAFMTKEISLAPNSIEGVFPYGKKGLRVLRVAGRGTHMEIPLLQRICFVPASSIVVAFMTKGIFLAPNSVNDVLKVYLLKSPPCARPPGSLPCNSTVVAAEQCKKQHSSILWGFSLHLSQVHTMVLGFFCFQFTIK